MTEHISRYNEVDESQSSRRRSMSHILYIVSCLQMLHLSKGDAEESACAVARAAQLQPRSTSARLWLDWRDGKRTPGIRSESLGYLSNADDDCLCDATAASLSHKSIEAFDKCCSRLHSSRCSG